MHVFDWCTSAPMAWPELRAVLRPTRHHVEVQMIHALPGMGSARVQHDDPCRVQASRHGPRYPLGQTGRCAERVRAGVEDSHAVLSGHNKCVSGRERAFRKRKKCDGVAILDDPSRVA